MKPSVRAIHLLSFISIVRYSKLFQVIPSTMSSTAIYQTFSTDILPTLSSVLVRSINETRWWSAVIHLDNNLELDDCEASHPHGEWSWRLKRTNKQYVYLQNTYREGQLITSVPMNTNIDDRDKIISQMFF